MKQMKPKGLLFLFVFGMVICLMQTMALALPGDFFTISDITYQIITEPDGTNNGTVKLMKKNSTNGTDGTLYEGTLSIPATVTYGTNNYDVTDYDYNALTSELLTAIIVDENNITFSSSNGVLFSKDKTALYCYPNGKTETSYTIPDTVNKIVSPAFSGNVILTSIAFAEKDSVVEIESGTFSGCTKLDNINFSGPINFGSGTFARAGYELDEGKTLSLTFPAGSTFSSGVFSGAKIDSLVFEGKVTIPSGAFGGNSQLISVIFQDKATIDSGAFSGNSKLEQLTFNASANIGSGAFGGLGMQLEEGKALSLTFPTDSTFAAGAFSGAKIDSVTFEGPVTLPAGAFSGSSYFTSIVFKDTSIIDSGVFSGNSILENLTFGGPTSLSSGAFSSAGVSLEEGKALSLTFPTGSTFLGSAFPGAKIDSVIFEGPVTLPSGTFGGNVFTSIIFKDTSEIGDGVFSGNSKLETLMFGGSTSIGNGSFYAAGSALEEGKTLSITFPSDATIGASFSSTKIGSLVFEGKAEISSGAFGGNNFITSIIFKDESVIGDGVFYGCSKLENLTFGGSTSVGASFNSVANGLEEGKALSLTFPTGSTFSSGAFSGSNIDSLVFEGEVAIPSGAFGGNNFITSIIFKDKSELGSGVFGNLSKLETVTFGDSTSIAAGVFYAAGNGLEEGKSISLTFPSGSTFSNDTMGSSNISSVIFEGPVTLPEYIFGKQLTSLVFHDTAELADRVFIRNSKLKTVTFTGAVTVGNESFSQTAIEHLVFPEGSILTEGALAGMPQLKSLYIHDTDMAIPNNLFAPTSDEINDEQTNNTFTIYVPYSKLENYIQAFTSDEANKKYLDTRFGGSSHVMILGFAMIDFSSNGGKGHIDSKIIESNTNFTLPISTFTPPNGQKFKGWAISPDGTPISGTTYNVTDDVTFYAIWEDITYTVSFHANGATGSMDNVNNVLGNFTLPTSTFTPPNGQKFKGWAISPDGTPISGTTYNVTDDVTFYAIWASTNTQVTAVSIDSIAGLIDGTTINVELPIGSSIPTDTDKINIIFATGASLSGLTTIDNGNTWTFTITAEDGVTMKNYTIHVTVALPAPHTHIYDKEIASAEYLATKANCINAATYYKSCECGQNGTDTFVSGEKDNTNHISTEFTYVKNNDGTHKKSNKCCGAEIDTDEVCNYDNDNICDFCNYEKTPDNNDNNNNNDNNDNTDNNDKPVDGPQTGDNNNISLWITLLFVSSISIIGTIVINKKKRTTK